jgi:hypothetical protein
VRVIGEALHDLLVGISRELEALEPTQRQALS